MIYCLKLTLSSPQAIRDFFQVYLPAHLRPYIDIDSIQPAIASHVLPFLKELHNDLVFTVRRGKLCKQLFY